LLHSDGAEHKVVLTYELGKRTGATTDYFIAKLSHVVSHDRFQITSDGFYLYKPAVKSLLRGRVDLAQLVNVYASPREGEQRHSPAEVVDAVQKKSWGPQF
jgi:hypothetical protein